MAIPRAQLATLEKVLKAAQLKPVTFGLGAAALEAGPKDSALPTLTLALGVNTFELLVTTGGGIVASRSLDGAFDADGGQKRIDADLVAREIRITLGQLPAALGDRVRNVRVFGRGELARQFVTDVSPRLDSMGLRLEAMERSCSVEFTEPPPADVVLSPALALAANRLREIAAGPDLLPPKVSQWQQFVSTRFSSRKLAWAGAGACGLVLCIGGAFLVQQWQLSRLNSQWKAIEPKVTELKNSEQLRQKYAPWFDDSFRAMRILKRLTEAFPEEGSVSAKSVEIRDLSNISVTGVAQNNQAYLRMLEQLRKADEITEVKTDSVRGQSPLQFTFNFQWEGGKGNGN
jgi:hypothetical protein